VATSAGYSGTPLAKKLGIKPGFDILTINPPVDYLRLVDPLPEGVSISDAMRCTLNNNCRTLPRRNPARIKYTPKKSAFSNGSDRSGWQENVSFLFQGGTDFAFFATGKRFF